MGALLVLGFGRSVPVSDIPGVELGTGTFVDERPAQKRLLVGFGAEDISQDIGVARLWGVFRRAGLRAVGRGILKQFEDGPVDEVERLLLWVGLLVSRSRDWHSDSDPDQAPPAPVSAPARHQGQRRPSVGTGFCTAPHRSAKLSYHGRSHHVGTYLVIDTGTVT